MAHLAKCLCKSDNLGLNPRRSMRVDGEDSTVCPLPSTCTMEHTCFHAHIKHTNVLARKTLNGLAKLSALTREVSLCCGR